MRLRGFRGTLVHFTGDPRRDPAAVQHLADGLLLVDGAGRIVRAAPFDAERDRGFDIEDHRGRLILPGFVDAHVHYPQIDVMACHAADVLDWLERHTFPAEARFADAAHARRAAEFFLDELARNGTTTAAVLPSVHGESVEAFFAAAAARNLRMACGKVMMDRHGPAALRDEPEASYRESAALLREWHGKGRLLYAVTPRFAATSSERQLELAGRLAAEAPGVLLQTHASESVREVRRVKELFPWAEGYLDVYERYGLLREGTLVAHCVHLAEREWRQLAACGATAVHCPNSNLFLGSGLFDIGQARRARAGVALGTDIGAGTSFSMLRAMQDAYRVAQLRGHDFTALDGFYLATLGGARALGMDAHIGSFLPGREADFIVLRDDATPLMARRTAACSTLEERLFVHMHLGDDRSIAATYVLGERVSPPG